MIIVQLSSIQIKQMQMAMAQEMYVMQRQVVILVLLGEEIQTEMAYVMPMITVLPYLIQIKPMPMQTA